MAQGSRAEHVCAYAWRWSPGAGQPEQIAIAIAPRLLAKLSMSLPEGQNHSGPPIGELVWSDTQLPLGDLAAAGLKNLFTAESCAAEQSSIRMAAALAKFPVALLTNIS
jgi:maltooligosyltrehalose synthase